MRLQSRPVWMLSNLSADTGHRPSEPAFHFKAFAFWLLSSVLFVCGMLVAPWSYAGLQDGLVAYWSFDDCTAKDVSGNGHDGEINGNPQCVAGTQGKSFYFDGIDDYIHIPLTGDLMFNPNLQSFSITAWAKPIKMNFFDPQFAGAIGMHLIDAYTYILLNQGFEAKRNAYTAEGGAYISTPLVDKDNWHFFLWRQTELEQALLKRRQIGIGMLAEMPLQQACLA